MTRCTAGIDIGGTKLLMLAHLHGQDEPLVRRAATGPDATAADIEAMIEKFFIDNELTPDSVGIAVPGLVDGGRVVVCDVLPALDDWRGPVGLGAPHLLVNDIRGALAEEGSGLDGASAVVVTLCGTAIGSACLYHGQVLRGSRGWAGEIGSMPVPTTDGVKRLDDLAGGAAIVQAAGRLPAQVHAALAAGDQEVHAAITTAAEAFGLGIATLVNIHNPDVLRVAGGTLGYPGYWDTALATARTHALPELWEACTVDRIQDPELVVARGARRLAAAMIAGEGWVDQYL